MEITEYFRKSWLPAKNIVQQSVTSRHEVQYTVRYVIYCVHVYVNVCVCVWGWLDVSVCVGGWLDVSVCDELLSK